eukprot:1473646-Pleurochrysis_carterae.AAC.1
MIGKQRKNVRQYWRRSGSGGNGEARLRGSLCICVLWWCVAIRACGGAVYGYGGTGGGVVGCEWGGAQVKLVQVSWLAACVGRAM